MAEKKVVGARRFFILKHKVKCTCGWIMSIYKQKEYHYVECKNQNCQTKYHINGSLRKTIREDYLLNALEQILSCMEFNTGLYAKQKKRLYKMWKRQDDEFGKQVKSIKKEIDQIDVKIDALNEMYITGEFEQEEYIRLKSRFKESRKLKNQKIENHQKANTDRMIEAFEDFLMLGKFLRGAFKRLKDEDLKSLFELLVKEIEMQSGSATITFTQLGNCYIDKKLEGLEIEDFELNKIQLQTDKSHIQIQDLQYGGPEGTYFELLNTILYCLDDIQYLKKLLIPS